ncbi:protein Wnt-8b-like [Mustelus asterias]
MASELLNLKGSDFLEVSDCLFTCEYDRGSCVDLHFKRSAVDPQGYFSRRHLIELALLGPFLVAAVYRHKQFISLGTPCSSLTSCSAHSVTWAISIAFSEEIIASAAFSVLSVNNFLMTGPKAYLIYSGSVAAGLTEIRLLAPPANREVAFVHAISSAGVMYTLTRNCSLGDFENCGCDDSRNGQLGGQGWLWGGCSDNVGFGESISKQFVDALETGQDARAAMNLHNNEAGRKAVKGTMKRTCKCHGVSGSCTTQTCWLQLPEFREVGDYLKDKYHRALKVDLLRGAGNSAASRGAIAESFSSISKKELVHLEESPDYCVENRTLGLAGTEGRECLKRDRQLSRWEKRSCKRLCGDCGLAVAERRAQTLSSCNCKFHWCCAVRCEQCRKTIIKYYCLRKEKKGRNQSASKRKESRPGRRH